MTVTVTQPSINVREKLAELDKPTGIAGEAMLRAETPQEQFNLIGAGRRNLLINGAMQHWQRGTGPTAVGSSGDYLPDRFKFWNSTGGAYTFERSTDTPNGFAYSTKLQVTTADTSLGAAEYSIFAQHLEVQDCLSARMGYSDAQELTLSFWVKSSKTGTYSMTLHKEEGTDYFCHRTFNINAANTWEYKSFTYPPNTLSGISANSTGTGFRVVCWLAAGSSYDSSGTEGQWSSSVDRYASDQNVNWMDSTSNNFYITGVQLELGKVATPFEHRSYGEELALCQRYFERVRLADRYQGKVHNVTQAHFTYSYRVKKRATPTLSNGLCTSIYDGTTSYTNFSSKDHDGINDESVTYRIITGSSMGTPVYRNLGGYGLGFDINAEL
jgi:hypothetical protein